MNCQNCGNYNNDSNRFCINCGEEVMLVEDYYYVLGIPRNSTKEDIKKAYYILAHQYHPDKNNGNEKRFKKINEAYRILSSDTTKKEYDEKLRKSNTTKSSGFESTDRDFGSNKTKNNNKGEVGKNTNKSIYIAVFVAVAVIVIANIAMNSSDEILVEDNQQVADIENIKDEGTYLIIGGEPVVKDDFSLTFSWLTAGEVLETREVSVVNEYLYEEPHTNGMFAIIIISIKNIGKERRLISLNNFQFLDENGRIYEPYYSFKEFKSTYDEKGKVVPVVSGSNNMIISIQPGIEEKRAIIFEIAKDIKSASLSFKYNNK